MQEVAGAVDTGGVTSSGQSSYFDLFDCRLGSGNSRWCANGGAKLHPFRSCVIGDLVVSEGKPLIESSSAWLIRKD